MHHSTSRLDELSNNRVASTLLALLPVLAAAGFVLLTPDLGWAVGGLDSLTARIEQLNTWLVSLGAVLAVTGFVWACLSIMFGMAGAAKAVSVLVVGLAIASAPQIVSFLVG